MTKERTTSRKTLTRRVDGKDGALIALSQDQLELIKRTVAKGATNDELALFLNQAHRLQLDPLSRQIHFIKRWDSSQQQQVGAVQTGIDGFRLIAARTGRYRPDELPPRFTYDEAGRLLSAKTCVYLFHPETTTWYRVEAEAFFDEYAQKTREGKLFPNWERMPRVMLSKVAEALALRKAFPAELSGVYAHEEMPEMPLEPAAPPASGPQSEVPAPVASANPQQGEAIHRLWHAKLLRTMFSGDHETAERALDAWLQFTYGVPTTTGLSFQQASEAIGALQRTPVEDLQALTSDLMRMPPADAASAEV